MIHHFAAPTIEEAVRMRSLEVEEHDRMATLLPYLDSSSTTLYLKLSTISEKAEIREKHLFPFLVVIDSDPLTRLIEAQFVTDEGSELKRVFLLVQRDRYHFQSDDLWPINNQKIDDLWQKAFSFYSNKDQESPLLTLSQQMAEGGKLRPFHPLFFCKTRQLFFHPPCPKCGSLLHQCYDDDLLSQSGLQPYSISLKRYLFCPSCSQERKSDFYIDELECNDNPVLKGRQSLIKEFGQLVLDRKQNAQFPCIECPQKNECYGLDDHVLSRIIPFSFSPFYMLIFEAMSLHALDFLPLVSGATFEEVETLLSNKGDRGRELSLKMIRQKGLTKAPVLFDQDPRNFYEVLYLKLSFLEEIIHAIISDGEKESRPDLKFSMDHIWVKMEKESSLLPFFWNFKVKIIDLGANPFTAESSPKTSLFQRLHFLTRVWFYTLLVNKRQNISRVYQTLNEERERFSENRFVDYFSPANIFWDPEGKAVSKMADPLWEKSLRLGWALYQNSLKGNLKWSKETFLKELDQLREEVKRSLFPERSIEPDRTKRPETPVETKTEDEAIHSILAGILSRWLTEPQGEEQILETVILSPLGKARDSSMAPKLDRDEKRGPPIKGGKIGIPDKGTQDSDGEDVIVETVILGAGKKISSLPSSGREMEEAFREKKDYGPGRTPEEGPSGEDFLDETVIQGSKKVQDNPKNKKNG